MPPTRGEGMTATGSGPRCRQSTSDVGQHTAPQPQRSFPGRHALRHSESSSKPCPLRGSTQRLINESPSVDRSTRGCRPRRLAVGGLRLHRRGQRAREHPGSAVVAPVLRHRLPPRLLSSRYCVASRRSVPPQCGWQRPPQIRSRHPRSELLCSCYLPEGRHRHRESRFGRPVAPMKPSRGQKSFPATINL